MPTVSEVSNVSYSGDIRVDSLLHETVNWNYLLPARTTLYYTFSLSVADETSNVPQSVSAFNAAQKAAVVAILNYASTVTGITFAETASGSSADFHFRACDLPSLNEAGLCNTSYGWSRIADPAIPVEQQTVVSYSGEAFIYLDNANHAGINNNPTAGGQGYEVLLHEIGHALGLGHPFDDTTDPNERVLPSGQDNTDNTVMSYTHSGSAKTTFQSYDLLALTWIYGNDGLGGLYGYNSANGPSLNPAAPSDDFSATTATTGSVVLGGSRTGIIETANDRDWFSVALQAGTRYVFELKGAASSNGSLADPSLRLLSSTGTQLAANNDNGTNADSRIEFTAASSGTYYLEAFSAQSSAIGSYRVSAVVNNTNRAPIAVADAFAGTEDVAITGNVLVNDSDPDAQALTAQLVSQPLHGSLQFLPNGQFVYTPQNNYAGSDTFTYRASDGTLSSAATAVTLTLAAVNDAPVAANGTRTLQEDTPITGQLTATDPDSPNLTYSVVAQPQHGTLTLAANGNYTYTPAADYNGTDSFGWRASDGSLSSNTATLSLTITASDDVVAGTPGDDNLVDTTGGNATLLAGAGNDRLRGGSGNDVLDGGDGIDTAVYAGVFGNFRIEKKGATWTVTDKTGAEGTDTLIGIEMLDFSNKDFSLQAPARTTSPAFGLDGTLLFDPVYYLLKNPTLNLTTGNAAQNYLAIGAAQGRTPNAWFDAAYYANKWSDLKALNLDAATLFQHYNLFGVWEGRSAGPAFDKFNGARYLAENPDVAEYVDARVADFLGSRSNGAIAHYIIYGSAEQRPVFDLVGQPIKLDYTVDFGA